MRSTDGGNDLGRACETMTAEKAQTPDASFEHLFDGLPAPALVLDPGDGTIRAANQAAAELLGYSRDALSGMSAADIHPHEQPRLREFFQEVTRHGTWQRDDLSCRTCDGVFVPAEIRSTVLSQGERPELLVLIRDLRGEQLAEVGQSVRKLVHDLRNALSTAQLLSDRLQGHDDPNVRTGADVMSRSLERALDLCQQTLRAGRAEEQRPDPTRFLLDDVVDDLMATAVLPSGLGAQIAFDPADSVALDADYDQVYRILLNLVRNASDAGAQIITVRGRRVDGAAVITVADDGPGLPDSVLASLDREKRQTAGTSGLGLMIAADLARGHGGAMTVESTGPAGTTFRIELPDQL